MSNYQTGNAQNGGQRQRKEIINKWEGIGVVRSRSRDGNEPVKIQQFQNGGAAINVNVVVSEFTGKSDENGNPKYKTTSIPVNVYTNKNITVQTLQAVCPGCKVHVVGSLAVESYQNKETNQFTSKIVANAFVFEIMEQPMQPAAWGQQPYGQQPGYAPQYGQPAMPQGFQPQVPQYGQPAMPQGFQPQAPQYGQPAPAPGQAPYQQAPQYGQQPMAPQGYQPQAGPAPQQPQAPQYGAPAQGGNVRQAPYYQQPQAPQQPSVPGPADDDMPDFGNAGVQNQ